MNKEDILGTITYLLILGLAGVFTFTILKGHANASGMGDLYILFNIGGLAAGLVINALIFEFAHVLGAIIGGYKILSVCVLGFTLKKEGEKWKFGFGSYDGLTGETRIVPKDGNVKKANPYPHLWFGTLFYVIEAVVVMIFFSLYRNDEDMSVANTVYFFLTIGMVGFMIFIYNILPFQLDSKTDGYSLTLVSNPKNRLAYNELLRVKYELSLGNDVEIETFKEITNFTADLNMNKVYVLMNENRLDEAEKLLDDIINAKGRISYKTYINSKAQKLYIKLSTLSLEEAREFYEKEVPVPERREIADKTSMAAIRAYLLMSGLLDKSRSECVNTLNKVGKAYKKCYESRKAVELKLFNAALKMVCDAHPKWELDKYYLKEEKKK